MKLKYTLHRGFTLVELLVVIAIIGVLVGLTLPAVQAVRASARQTACQNNLKQVVTAAATHETALGYLPYHRGSYGGKTGCWVIPLLPHLGETAMWNSWEQGTTNYNTLQYLICPDATKKKEQAKLSYVANCGKVGKDSDGGSDYAFYYGALVNQGCKRSMISKMKDGASYTILFSENNQATRWQYTNTYDYGIMWGGDVLAFGALHNATATGNRYARPSSNHPQNGAHIAFADGSVKYGTKSIDALLYSQLMAPNDKKAGVSSATMDLSKLEK